MKERERETEKRYRTQRPFSPFSPPVSIGTSVTDLCGGRGPGCCCFDTLPAWRDPMLQKNPLNNPQGKNKKIYFLASCKGRDKVNGAGLRNAQEK